MARPAVCVTVVQEKVNDPARRQVYDGGAGEGLGRLSQPRARHQPQNHAGGGKFLLYNSTPLAQHLWVVVLISPHWIMLYVAPM